MAFNYSPKIVTNGLVFAVDAANTKSYPGTGATWKDLSGNNNNGSTAFSPTFSNLYGGSFVFNGTNYVSFPSTTVNPLNGDTLTVEVWIRHNTFGTSGPQDGRGYISNWQSFNTLNQRGFLLRTYVNQTNPSFWWCWGGGNNYDAFGPSSYVMVVGVPYHIVATYEKNVGVKIYINGTLQGSSTTSTNNTIAFDTTNGITIGYSPINNSFMDGNVFSSKLYNRVLSATEVLQNYNATKSRFGL